MRISDCPCHISVLSATKTENWIPRVICLKRRRVRMKLVPPFSSFLLPHLPNLSQVSSHVGICWSCRKEPKWKKEAAFVRVVAHVRIEMLLKWAGLHSSGYVFRQLCCVYQNPAWNCIIWTTTPMKRMTQWLETMWIPARSSNWVPSKSSTIRNTKVDPYLELLCKGASLLGQGGVNANLSWTCTIVDLPGIPIYFETWSHEVWPEEGCQHKSQNVTPVLFKASPDQNVEPTCQISWPGGFNST